MSPYSPERRTALVLCGTGAHGAYHAGVLRALQEAGVKIDLVAGQGIGAGGAALTAIGGSSRLWEDDRHLALTAGDVALRLETDGGCAAGDPGRPDDSPARNRRGRRRRCGAAALVGGDADCDVCGRGRRLRR